MRLTGQYNHLDEHDPFTVELDFNQIAIRSAQMNYGTHRLLSAVVFTLLGKDPSDPMAKVIKDQLDSGYY